jgi:ABC-type polysaccharide/polyol phosphate export permease
LFSSGINDFVDGARNWRVWYLLGGNNLRQRYARSALGQWWIVLGTVIINTAFGLLWSQLWGHPIAEYLPYVAIGHICWALITSPLMDAIQALPANSFYYVNQRAPISTSFFAGYFRSVLIFAHNLVIVPLLWLLFAKPDFSLLWAVIPAILLISIISINLSILIGLISCRFRDAGQVIGNALQVVYFLTPVMWMAEFLPKRAVFVVEYNPFAQMLFILRDPLLGKAPELYSWAFCIVMAVATFGMAIAALNTYGRRAVYWM